MIDVYTSLPLTPIRRLKIEYDGNNNGRTTADCWLCPDLLEYAHIGAADNLRGRVVRAFFWLMRIWSTTR